MPILRWLHEVEEAKLERRSLCGSCGATDCKRHWLLKDRSWVQFDDRNTDIAPKFDFPSLQQSLSACTFPLPILSGSWVLEQRDQDLDDGNDQYILIAYPLTASCGPTGMARASGGGDVDAGMRARKSSAIPGPPPPPPPGDGFADDGGLRCLVLAFVFNAKDERHNRIGVGRGSVDAARGALSITLCLTNPMEFVPFRSYRFLSGNCDSLSSSSGDVLRRVGDTGALSRGPPATNSAAELAVERMSAEMERLLAGFVPEELPLPAAVEAGDADLVLRLIGADPDLRLQPLLVRTRRLVGEAPPLIAAAVYGNVALVDALFRDEEEALREDPWALVCAGCGQAADRLLELVAARPALLESKCPPKHPVVGGLRLRGASLLEAALALGHRPLAERLVGAGHPHSPATAVQMGEVEWLKTHRKAWERSVNRPFPSSVGRPGSKTFPVAEDCENRWAQVGTYTLLIAAVRRCDAAAVRVLLEGGADVFIVREGQFSTAINYAQVGETHGDTRLRQGCQSRA